MSTNILSPVPGIFYRRPSPDEDVFVNEGDSVKAGDIVGLVEVMKTFYEIKAEADGKIAEILVENEGLIEAGQTIATLTDE